MTDTQNTKIQGVFHKCTRLFKGLDVITYEVRLYTEILTGGLS